MSFNMLFLQGFISVLLFKIWYLFRNKENVKWNLPLLLNIIINKLQNFKDQFYVTVSIITYRVIYLSLWELIPAIPASFHYLLRVNDRKTTTRCQICSKLTIKTPKGRQWRRSGVFIVSFEHVSHLVLVFLLLTLNKYLAPGTWIYKGVFRTLSDIMELFAKIVNGYFCKKAVKNTKRSFHFSAFKFLFFDVIVGVINLIEGFLVPSCHQKM